MPTPTSRLSSSARASSIFLRSRLTPSLISWGNYTNSSSLIALGINLLLILLFLAKFLVILANNCTNIINYVHINNQILFTNIFSTHIHRNLSILFICILFINVSLRIWVYHIIFIQEFGENQSVCGFSLYVLILLITEAAYLSILASRKLCPMILLNSSWLTFGGIVVKSRISSSSTSRGRASSNVWRSIMYKWRFSPAILSRKKPQSMKHSESK